MYTYFLVENCYSFSLIFAWKSHKFSSHNNLEGRVVFPFQEGFHLLWQIVWQMLSLADFKP